MSLEVAVLGCGSAGRRHIGNLLALGCKVFALDPSLEALAKVPAGAVPFHMGPQSGVAVSDFDALVIATPYDRHLEWVEAAINERVPFFVEKPLGSLEQLPRWRELATRVDLPVHQIGYQLRFHTVVRWMRNGIQSPDLGGFYCDCDSSTWPGRAYGPMLLEMSHELDLALYCGAPSRVARVDQCSDASWSIWLGDDEQWLISVDALSKAYLRHWWLSDGVSTAVARFHAPEELGDQMYRDEMAHFLDCVREQKPTICPLRDGLRVLEICQQVETMVGQAA